MRLTIAPASNRANAPLPVRRGGWRAFTLFELLLAVTLIVVIIYALFLMFNQTQLAFRRGVTQVDVMEAGRAALDIIANEVQHMAASGIGNVENFDQYAVRQVNFLNAFVQALPDGTVITNELEEFYFVTNPNGRSWRVMGFFVSTNATPAPSAPFGPGTLYRFQSRSTYAALGNVTMANEISQVSPTNTLECFPICEGIIHFKIRPMRSGGARIGAGSLPLRGDEVPGYVDVEIGIVDPPLLAVARAQPNTNALINFLSSRPGSVHYFRQTIAVPSVLR